MKEAGVALIINQDGYILSISRRNNKSLFGLPGGKLDTGIDFDTRDAAIREAQEETSVVIKDCCFIFEKIDDDFMADCYYATQWEGEPKTNEEGEVRWLTAVQLTTTMAAFGEYNIKALHSFHKLYPDVKVRGLDAVLKTFAQWQLKRFKLAVEEIVGPVSGWTITDNSLMFRAVNSITLKQVTALSELFGTDEINFNFGNPGEPDYSEMTPGCSAEVGYVQILRKGISKEAP